MISNLNEKIQFVCPVTGLKLFPTHCDNIYLHYEDILTNDTLHVTGLLTTINQEFFYPIINDIYILKPEFRCQSQNMKLLPNIFSYENCSDKNDWYRSYSEGYAFWKIDFFSSKIKSQDIENPLVVEFMCAGGDTLNLLTIKNQLLNQVCCGVDYEFSHLLRMKNKYPEFTAVCANAEDIIFDKNSIDIIYSNSVHHLSDPNKFFDNVYLYLKSNGIFIGVESYGIFSKIILYLIRFCPDKILPYFFSEIKQEFNLLKKWLEMPLERIISKGILNKYKTITHVKYTIKKS